ncbi:MAG: glutathione S-transferase family protein [Thermoleophilaceae bacterium]
MEATLYSIKLSHPGHAARLMLEHKGIEHDVTMFPAGLHPVLVRLAGFSGYTVPALKIDGRRTQTSLAIARELERIKPEPSLYPAGEEARARVDEAERWGEAELQPVPRRMFRWALTQQREAREWVARYEGLPGPGLQARTNAPLVRRFANAVGATDERIRQDLAELAEKLDRVDELVGEGTLALEQPNAATFQIGTSIRALCAFRQLQPLIESRPCGDIAHSVLPEYPETPLELPAEWVPAVPARA